MGWGISVLGITPRFRAILSAEQGALPEFGGAGLGLAIVKSICTAHGAEIKV